MRRKIPNCTIPQRGIIRGDALSASIAAASIIAKTTRDAHMLELDGMYSGYGLASHKGYPTPEHCRALKAWARFLFIAAVSRESEKRWVSIRFRLNSSTEQEDRVWRWKSAE